MEHHESLNFIPSFNLFLWTKLLRLHLILFDELLVLLSTFLPTLCKDCSSTSSFENTILFNILFCLFKDPSSQRIGNLKVTFYYRVEQQEHFWSKLYFRKELRRNNPCTTLGEMSKVAIKVRQTK